MVENGIKRMYAVLEDMVRSAQAGDSVAVLRLAKEYELLKPKIQYGKMDYDLASDYDNCRQSCALTANDWPVSRKKLLNDVKERFARIPKPL
jgi:hypothetical protein